MPNFARLLRSIAAVPRRLLGNPGPFLSHPERIDGVNHATIQPTARIYVGVHAPDSTSRVKLGRGVYLGRHVELAAPRYGTLSLGDDTSVQDFCTFHGDIDVGAHCIFSLHVLISSTIHRFRDRPQWLIRDQDAAAQIDKTNLRSSWSRPIVIEDDCWFGWSAAVMPGIYIGRGAVIGANCVVTGDIGPYEIHGGVPNRNIGTRLAFSPPAQIDAMDETAMPYFYRGFYLAQAKLARSREAGVVDAKDRVTIILQGGVWSTLNLRGLNKKAEADVRVRINGSDAGNFAVGSGKFELTVPIVDQRPPGENVRESLRKHTIIELEYLSAASAGADEKDEMNWGIVRARLS